MLKLTDFGAIGDGVYLNTEVFQKAIDASAEKGEGLCIPAGTFLTGTILLKGVSLYLEAGAVIKGSTNIEDYPEQDYIHNELGALRALIINRDADNVSITGEGIIDLSGKAFYDTSVMNVPQSKVPFNEKQIAECTYPIGTRPGQCIFFHNSKNVRVSGITILDAPCWTLSFHECENVKVTGLTIDTDLNVPNDDGIHLCSCKGVIISDCNISSGDDCIALSCITNWEKPCEDVVITNCVLRSCSKAIVIGYIYSVIRNVTISNCIIKESNRGLCFMCNDECGLIENVRVNNMIIDTRIRAGNWWGNGEPIFLMALKHDYHIPAEQKPGRVTNYAIRNVYIDGVTCMGENAIGIVGKHDNIREVTLKNIDFTRKKSENLMLKGTTLDLSPSRVEIEVPVDCGLYVEGPFDVTFENVNTRQWSMIMR
ncbi:MAG: right-handed parallel beta-helix repeat-containing protein [Lachnospiraceae bacterium]|nr:right-handed parallel beta-helix repeat-containing protein [Lachnospiraceae bacterium]